MTETERDEPLVSEKMDPAELLRKLRTPRPVRPDGTITTCGCGRPLVQRFMDDDESPYVTHEGADDEDHHYAYFSGIRIRRVEEDEG